jgi:hypothetical protein
MATELPKQYDPHQAQERWLQFWKNDTTDGTDNTDKLFFLSVLSV